MKYLIYDCENPSPSPIFEQYRSSCFSVINAAQPVAKCSGCFKCWLKNPGKCTFADAMEHIGSRILTSDEIIIVCKSLYGGFSVNVKRIIDRAIPGVLPFFEKKNQELHHCKRYAATPAIKAIFYDAEEMTEPEKAQAQNMIAAMALNFHASDFSVVFTNHLPQSLQEVMQ